MTKRLMNLRQIRAEKIARGRSWVYVEMAAGRFPKPISGCVPNLWDETEIDAFVESFVEAARARPDTRRERVTKAAAGRAQRAA